MTMPGYEQYSEWFGNTPLAVHMGMDQLNRARAQDDEILTGRKHQNRAAELSNMFSEQHDPIRLEQAQATLEGTRIGNQGSILDNQAKEINNRFANDTYKFKLDEQQRKHVLGMKQHELDLLEVIAQKDAYSPDPKVRAQGEAMLKMHKDFVKLREQQRLQHQTMDKQHGMNKEMEDIRNKNITGRQAAQAKLKADTSQAVDKMSLQQRISFLSQKALEAYQAGDFEAHNFYRQEADLALQQAKYLTPDTQAGKPDISQMDIPVVPERPIPSSRYIPPQNSLGAPPPQQLPAGAKQIGTSKGRPVYELNGKRYILE